MRKAYRRKKKLKLILKTIFWIIELLANLATILQLFGIKL